MQFARISWRLECRVRKNVVGFVRFYTDTSLFILSDYEVSFLRLIEKVTNGTSIVINETGTSVLVRPGTIPGGKYTHTCPTSRSIGYFLEAVIPLGVFGKVGLEIKFDGITGEEGRDLTVSDTYKTPMAQSLVF